MSDFLVIDKLSKIYPTKTGEAVIVKDFDLRIKEGEFVSLIGHSGCGKSTVLSMIAGLTDITSGVMILNHKELIGAGPDRGVVFQSPCLLPWMTAFENIMLGIDQVFFTATANDRKNIAEYYLHIVGLGDSMNKKPKELSQGMQQRVGLARAFSLAPKMLLLDEPFGMLDSLTRYELQSVLLKIWEERKTTTLMVTHDVDESIYLSDRVVMMNNGPEAQVGDILEIHFDRPRDRAQLSEDPEFFELRSYLLSFLERHSHKKGTEIPFVVKNQQASNILNLSKSPVFDKISRSDNNQQLENVG